MSKTKNLHFFENFVGSKHVIFPESKILVSLIISKKSTMLHSIAHLRYGDAGFSHYLTPQVFDSLGKSCLHLSGICIELVIVRSTFQHYRPAYLQLQYKHQLESADVH